MAWKLLRRASRGPSDEKQFETMELGYAFLLRFARSVVDLSRHMLYFILDSTQPEPLFHSPVGKHPQV